MLNNFIDALQQFYSGISLRISILLPFLVLTSTSIILTGYLAFLGGQQTNTALIQQLLDTSATHIQHYLQSKFRLSDNINQINIAALKTGMLDVSAKDKTGTWFWRQRQIFDVDHISFTSAEGEFVGAGHYLNTTRPIIEIIDKNSNLNQLHIYNTSAEGHLLDLLEIRDNFQPLADNQYQSAVQSGQRWRGKVVRRTDFPQVLSVPTITPVYDDQQQLLGAFRVDLFLPQISEYLSHLSISQHGNVFIIDDQGQLIATSDQTSVFEHTAFAAHQLLAQNSLSPLIRDIASQIDLSNINTSVPIQLSTIQGHYLINVNRWQKLPATDWRIIIALPESEFMFVLPLGWHTAVIVVIAVLLLVLLPGLFITQWVKPIQYLCQMASKLAEGEWDIPLHTHRQDELGQLACTFGQMRDKLQHSFHTLENALTGLRSRNDDLSLVAKVFQASCEAIIITDMKGCIVRVNQAFTSITGYSENEAIGNAPSLLKSGRHNNDFFRDMWAALNAVGYWSGEIWNRRKNEEIFPGWLSINVIHDQHGNVQHYIGVLTDNTPQQRSQDRLAWLAYYDPLTSLPNRQLFRERLMQLLKQSQQRLVGLVVIDIDGFKGINEALGYTLGDYLLQEMATRLINFEAVDQELITRLSSDEFAMVFSNLTADKEVLVHNLIAQVQQLQIHIQQPMLLGGQILSVTACIGIAVSPQDGNNAIELMKNANAAMTRAKQHGNGMYQFFTAAMTSDAHKRLMLQNHLRLAIRHGELQVYYQPQVDIQTHQLIGMEALVRWQHPQLGMIPPSEFIPLAEESGLIIPIGEWVLRTACTQNRQWQQQMLPKVRIAVNLSLKQFTQPDLPMTVACILQDTGLDPRWLELEITESLAMHSAAETLHTLQQLKQLGLYLAMDDFGTGYSSLSYLRQFNMDVLKIDASFIADIHTKSGQILVDTIIRMAHGLGMKIIAEGVEVREQLEWLRSRPCDIAQGYLFSRPLDVQAMTELLKKSPVLPLSQSD